MKEGKRKVDEEFSIKLNEKFNENELFWKEVKKKREGVGGVNVRIKGEDGLHVKVK